MNSVAEEISFDLNTMGGRLSHFFESKGLGRPEAARLLDIPYERMSSYARNRAEPNATFFATLLSKFPDVDIGWIMTGVQSSAGGKPWEATVPVLEEIRAGDLTIFIDPSSIIGYISTVNTKDKDLFGLLVKGDSMFPELVTGDIAICAPHRRFVNGQIYAVRTDDDSSSIKRVFKRNYGYDLVPSNPDYQSIFVGDANIVRLARVIEIQRKLE